MAQLVGGCRRRCGGGCGRCCLCLGSCQHILLADAAADAGAGEGRDVDALLVGQLADQGSDVAGLCRCGSCCRRRGSCRGGGRRRSSRCGSFLLGSLRCCCRCGGGRRFLLGGFRCCFLLGGRGGRRCGRCRGAGTDDGQNGADLGRLVLVDADFQEGSGNRGRDFGVDLVGGNLEQRLVDLYGVADALQPAGHSAFGDAFTQGRQRDVVSFTCRSRFRSGGRGLGGRSLRGSLFCGRRRCGGSRCLFGGRGRSLCRGRGGVAGADADQRGANFSGLVLGDEDFLDHAGDRRGDLGVYFVGGDFEQRLVHLYPVTDLLEPAGDGSFGDALTEGGQVNGFRHVVPVLLIDL